MLSILTGQGSLLSPPPVTANGVVKNDAIELQPFELVFLIFIWE